MSPRPLARCDDLLRWLRENLGRSALAALTGTDGYALHAAAHILELYAYGGDPDTLAAFQLVVEQMQPKTRYLAYHAIAWVNEWENRAVWWLASGLAPLETIPPCKYEPRMRTTQVT